VASGAPALSSPLLKALTIDAVLSQSNKKRALLFVALLVVAGLVGFGLGVALWEGSGITLHIFQ